MGVAPVQYDYSSALQLTSVTNADSTTHQYSYGALNPTALTSEIDENGTAFASWGYDAQGRAISSSQSGGANATSLVYNSGDSVTVTDALGAVRIFSFSRSGDRKPVTGDS
jgi:uncharacterized protein RhaS with RHS repeats